MLTGRAKMGTMAMAKTSRGGVAYATLGWGRWWVKTTMSNAHHAVSVAPPDSPLSFSSLRDTRMPRARTT